MSTSPNKEEHIKHSIAKKIYENRLAVCKDLIEHDAFDPDIYAAYFEIPKHLVQKDLTQEDIPLPDYDPTVKCSNITPLETLIAQRTERLQGKETDRKALEEEGFWHIPTDNYKNPYRFHDPDLNIRLQDAAVYYQNERTCKKHAFSYVAELFSISPKKFIAYTKAHNIKRFEDRLVEEYEKDLRELLRYSPATDVSGLTDIPVAKLYKISKEISESYKEEKRNLAEKYTPSPRAHTLEKRRQEIWKMYTGLENGKLMTEQEIAEKVVLSRQTVISDLKAYRKEHPEFKRPDGEKRPRHLSSDETKKKQDQSTDNTNKDESS